MKGVGLFRPMETGQSELYFPIIESHMLTFFILQSPHLMLLFQSLIGNEVSLSALKRCLTLSLDRS